MILSMTGFGEARSEDGGQLYHVEVRSVNNRYFKASIHLPDDFAFLEADLERAARERVSRGSVGVRVHLRDLSGDAAQTVNAAALRSYVAQLQSAAGPGGASIDLATLALLPGVCQPHDYTQAQRDTAAGVIRRLLDRALDNMIEMRRLEGRVVLEDLRLHCNRLLENLEAIRLRAPLVIDEYRERLRARVSQLIAASGAQLAENDLLREVAVYAERSDISEEISRLRGHVDQFTSLLTVAEPAGRKLDFIAQEMLREANTIGSKSGDGVIGRATIEIKCAIDRLKEQVQNVE